MTLVTGEKAGCGDRLLLFYQKAKLSVECVDGLAYAEYCGKVRRHMQFEVISHYLSISVSVCCVFICEKCVCIFKTKSQSEAQIHLVQVLFLSSLLMPIFMKNVFVCACVFYTYSA